MRQPTFPINYQARTSTTFKGSVDRSHNVQASLTSSVNRDSELYDNNIEHTSDISDIIESTDSENEETPSDASDIILISSSAALKVKKKFLFKTHGIFFQLSSGMDSSKRRNIEAFFCGQLKTPPVSHLSGTAESQVCPFSIVSTTLKGIF